MKVRCIKETKRGRDVGKYEIYFGDVTKGEIYEVLSIGEKSGWYRIIDASEEDYLYPPNLFEIIEKEPAPPIEESKIKKNNDIIFNKEKSDPPSMTEEEYFKARDEYIQKVRKESEKLKGKNGY